MTSGAPDNRLVLIACGILAKEIMYLVKKNNWPVKVRFLDSSLHVDLEKLSSSLESALSAESQRQQILVFGTCHPRIGEITADAGASRVPGQNCVELLLGHERFISELEKGAFFLFEDWANRWEAISLNYFQDWELMKEIFREGHKYILCLNTPCSNNFETKANELSQRIGLPLIWEDFTLDILEKKLETVINNADSGE